MGNADAIVIENRLGGSEAKKISQFRREISFAFKDIVGAICVGSGQCVFASMPIFAFSLKIAIAFKDI